MTSLGDAAVKRLSEYLADADAVTRRLMAIRGLAPTLLATVICWELVILVSKSGRKLLWYDELITLHISNIHPLSHLWNALQLGVDGMPFIYYVLVQLSRELPVGNLVALRLPSIFGYVLTLLCVCIYASRNAPVSVGAIAVLLVAISPFRDYALEARSYALLVGVLALSAVLWQRTDTRQSLMPWLLFLTLSLAVALHHLAVVLLAVFGSAELVWSVASRRIRWRVWCALVLATFPFFVNLPLLLRFREIFGPHFWSQPSLSAVVDTYDVYLGIDNSFSIAILGLVGVVVCDALVRRVRSLELPSESAFSAPEIVLVSGLVCFPAFLVVLTRLFHSGYAPRYGWPAIIGLALGISLVCYQCMTKRSLKYVVLAFTVAFLFQAWADVKVLAGKGAIAEFVESRWQKVAELARKEPGVPLVIGEGTRYLEAVQYAPSDIRDRLVEVVDPSMAVRYTGADSVEKTNRLLTQFAPLHTEDLAQFQATHGKFLLFSGGGFDWMTPYLVENGYHLRLLFKGDLYSMYVVER